MKRKEREKRRKRNEMSEKRGIKMNCCLMSKDVLMICLLNRNENVQLNENENEMHTNVTFRTSGA